MHYKKRLENERYILHHFCIGAFGVNSYILICKSSRDACIIDPGGALDVFKTTIEAEESKVVYILATHAHIDHVLGVGELKASYPKAKIAYHADEQIVVDHLDLQSKLFSFPKVHMPELELDLKATPNFSVGEIQIHSIPTPGHTPGGVCFYLPREKLLFTGDLLFKGSVGRTDFEGGDGVQLKASLTKVIENVPRDVTILPGHGKSSSIDAEIKENLFLRIEQWR